MNDPKDTTQNTCIRCGTCCTKGGPALHREDRRLFDEGILNQNLVYTLRKGEAVRDVDDTLKALDHEIIKIKGRGKSWTCLFFDPEEKGCTIYPDRPLECRALKCWDLADLRLAMESPYLERRDFIDEGDGVLKIIAAHDQRCSYHALKTAVEALDGQHQEENVEKILELLQYDDFMRPFLVEKLRLEPTSMDFLFGRPLTSTIRMFGLQVITEGQNRMLVPLTKEQK